MSDVTDALAALKTALSSIDPSPQTGPNAVYAWPADADTIDWDTHPFVVVAQMLNEPFFFMDVAHGLVSHSWRAEINIALAAGPLTRYEAAKTAEAIQVDWLLALGTILSANRSLAGNAIALGQATGQLFSYRIGHIGGWVDARVSWGIRAEVWVLQHHGLSAS